MIIKYKKVFKKVIIILALLAAAIGIYALSVNAYVVNSSKKYITDIDGAKKINADCIVVLGAGVSGGKPSLMLQERLDKGIELYKAGAAPKIIMSGDHGRTNYNEVGIMREYALQNGVAAEDIFMDHAGFSTYETMYRVRDVFEAENIIAVSQNYHLYRCVYIAKSLGLNVCAVSCDTRRYAGQTLRDIREIIARNKDFLNVKICPEPTFLGDTIPVTGDGNVTSD